MALTDREREARIRERLRHRVRFEPDVYALSHEDANTIIQALARGERYREALEEIVNEDVGTVGDGSPQEVLIATQQAAHRALNDGEDDAIR